MRASWTFRAAPFPNATCPFYPRTRGTGGGIGWADARDFRLLEIVRKAGLDERLGRERRLFNARAALERYQALHAAGSRE